MAGSSPNLAAVTLDENNPTQTARFMLLDGRIERIEEDYGRRLDRFEQNLAKLTLDVQGTLQAVKIITAGVPLIAIVVGAVVWLIRHA